LAACSAEELRQCGIARNGRSELRRPPGEPGFVVGRSGGFQHPFKREHGHTEPGPDLQGRDFTGNLQLAKLTPVHIQSAYNGWASGGRRDGKAGGLAPLTRRHIHRILSSALARAVEQQLIARNPCDVFRTRLPKVERREMATLTPEQSARLLAAVRHSHIYWPVLIALATGARRGEVLAIRWRNVDLDGGTVRIVESLEQTKSGLRFKSPKTDRPRAVTLPSFAVDELRRLKQEQAESLLLVGVRQTGDTLVCARRDGEPLQPQSLTHEFPRFLAQLRTSRGCGSMTSVTATRRSCCLPGFIRRSLKSGSGIRL
jgi:integrase